MIDGVPNAAGNGYLIKAGSSFPADYAAFRTALLAGTLPLDINFNAAGWAQVGTALSKANLLSDTVAAAIKTLAGLSANPDTPNAALSALAAAVAGGAKIATGSYVGTGTYGSANPCSLTFDFKPKYIVVYGSETIAHMLSSSSDGLCDSHSINNPQIVHTSWNGNTVQTYADYSEIWQSNTAGAVYYYLALG